MHVDAGWNWSSLIVSDIVVSLDTHLVLRYDRCVFLFYENWKQPISSCVLEKFLQHLSLPPRHSLRHPRNKCLRTQVTSGFLTKNKLLALGMLFHFYHCCRLLASFSNFTIWWFQRIFTANLTASYVGSALTWACPSETHLIALKTIQYLSWDYINYLHSLHACLCSPFCLEQTKKKKPERQTVRSGWPRSVVCYQWIGCATCDRVIFSPSGQTHHHTSNRHIRSFKNTRGYDSSLRYRTIVTITHPTRFHI